jgi:tetratricopeptide (TPR) repeat protein
MKRIFILTIMACFALSSHAQVTTPPSGGNQKASVTQYMGLTHVTITYNSPDVTGANGQSREGKIWGQLVPYGLNNLSFGLSSAENPSPWRAGANENTTITFSHDVEIEGSPLKAGTYGLHMIPSETDWIIVFSENASSWGSYFYQEEEDALRVTVTPKKSEFHEWLSYEFYDRQLKSCTAALKWENLEVPFKIGVPNITELYAAQIDDDLRGSGGFNWQAWNNAANFYLSNKLDLNKALEYASGAVEDPFFGQKNFTTLSTKALVLEAMGNEKEANKVRKEAIQDPSATVFQIHGLGRRMIVMGKKKEALEIFKMNAKKYPKTWPINVGLARGYSANGDYKKALKHAKKAFDKAPDERNKNSLTAAIEKLKKNEDIN